MKTKLRSRGVSLLAIILAITFFTVLGYVALSMISTIGQKSADFNDSERAFHIAEAGLQVALRTLRDNWDNWKNQSNFPSGSVGGGTFSLMVSDDDDGDANPNVDTNRRVIVESTGFYNQARRKINTWVNKFPGVLDAALYLSANANFSGDSKIEGDIVQTDPQASITFSGSSEHEGEIFRDDTDTIPAINNTEYIELAKLNDLNGFGSRADKNYFRGDFSKTPESLNGVMYIDKFANGEPANVNLSSNIQTEHGSGNPAVLIVMGNLKITGNVNFHGLIYVTGEVQFEPELELLGNTSVEGTIISSNVIDAWGNFNLTYDESNVKTATNLSLISEVTSNKVYTSQWKEIYQ